MKFSSVLTVFGLAAVAYAIPQASSSNSTITHAPATSASTVAPPAPISTSPTQLCLSRCASSDICCQAACVSVPCPNPSQVNSTTECAAKCPQGNGTEPDTASYASCQSSCISSFFFASSSFNPSATASSGNGAATNIATTTGSGSAATSGSGSESSSASGSAASHSPSGSANNLQLGTASFGIIGLLIAGLAL